MTRTRSAGLLLARTALIAFASTLLALAVNAARPDSLALVAESEYEIYEECPENEDTATAIPLDEILEHRESYFFVDSRPPGEYAQEHIDGALSIPYDPLFPVSEEDVESIRSAAGDRTVVVVGDSLTAGLLASDLLSQGMSWARFLEKGAQWRDLMHAAGR